MITEGTTTVARASRAQRSTPIRQSASGIDTGRQEREAGPLTPRQLLWRRIAWVAVGTAWMFAAVSLLGFDAADPPAPGVFPHNSPVANWCGKFGALTAFYSYKMFGIGAWVVILLTALWLAITSTGRRVGQVSVRLLGVLLLAAAVSGMQALLAPNSGPVAGLPGGLIGTVGVHRLVESFSNVGSFLVLMLAIGIGATVALDVWALIVAAWTGKALFAVGRSGGRFAVAAAAAGYHRHQRNKAARQVRPDDVSDDITLNDAAANGSAVARKKSRLFAAKVAEDAGGLGGTEAFDLGGGGSGLSPGSTLSETDDSDDASTIAQLDDASTNSQPAAPKAFDPEALRAKIAKLPVRFAANTQRSATEEDLKDIQQANANPNTSQSLEGYRFPGVDLLEEPEGNYSATMEVFVREQAEALERAIKEYGIEGEVVGVESGPVITLFELRLAPGTKVAQLSAIASDLARSLKAVNIRIVSNMAGRDTVGVEVPNSHKEKVRLKELMTQSDAYAGMRLPMFLGKDASGEPLIADLSTMPHILIAGTTGSGKSVCMNTVIMSFLYTKKPNELKLVLVDPKMVELSQFKDIPHLMCPVVTEMGKAAAILEWAVGKMDERYELLAEAGCRDIAAYNELTWDELKDRLACTTPEEEAKVPRQLPYMVFVIDELADLMMTNKEVEHSIVRIAQKARAVGIHLILATQRPQANVVTGLIKSNMPARIAFKVASGMDSRIVLDQKGGELLLGQGDMLYLSPRSAKLTRAQGTLVDDKEIRRVVKFMREVAAPTFERQLLQIRSGGPGPSEEDARDGFISAQEDPMFDQAVEIVLETKRGSVSMLQRRLAIGYTRAARLIEMMGEAGILGTHKGTVAREVVMTIEEWQAMKAVARADADAADETDPEVAEKLRQTQAAVNGSTSSTSADSEDRDGDLDEEADGVSDSGSESVPFHVTTRATGGSTPARA